MCVLNGLESHNLTSRLSFPAMTRPDEVVKLPWYFVNQLWQASTLDAGLEANLINPRPNQLGMCVFRSRGTT